MMNFEGFSLSSNLKNLTDRFRGNKDSEEFKLKNIEGFKEYTLIELVKKITEEKVTEKSQDFLVKKSKTLKIEILMQVLKKNIRIEGL